MEDWWTKEPTDRYDYGSSFNEVFANNDEHTPDIAYDYLTGDVYLVYSEYQVGVSESYVKYRHFHRNPIQYFSDEYFVGDYLHNPHNGYDPSIDVGLINVEGLGNLHMVAVTYTSQFHTPNPISETPHVGYHLCGTGWLTSLTDGNRSSFQVRHPQNYWRDAGLSCVDIAPYDNTTHFVTCTYTQVTGANGFGPTTNVIVVNWFGSAANLTQHRTVNDADDDTDDGMYSSIAIHRDGGGECWASINYLAQANDGQNQNGWHPRVSLLQLDDFNEPQVNSTVVGDDPIVIGNYNISDIPFQNPGVSTAIMTNNYDMYWAAWADQIEMEPPPSFIMAAYGFAD